MSLRQLSLKQFRNIQATTLDFHPRYNFIFGSNASGKTSLLEAINFLCEGRSFKTRSSQICINNKSKDFLLFGRFNGYKIGISKSRSDYRIRLNNENVTRVSSFAHKAPVRLLDSSCFELLTGSPKVRRKFIDWYLFHVEHEYFLLWSHHQHALKQRNALLKQQKNLNQLDYWDELISEYCEQISLLREKHCLSLSDILKNDLTSIIGELEISITFKRGWDDSKNLQTLLKERRNKDLKYGFTSNGSHRDDLIIESKGIPLTHNLSRGQLKKLSIGLYLAQIKLFTSQASDNLLILVDDVSSEIDRNNLVNLFKILSLSSAQFFITNIDRPDFLFEVIEDYRLFHVEHGMINTVKNS